LQSGSGPAAAPIDFGSLDTDGLRRYLNGETAPERRPTDTSFGIESTEADPLVPNTATSDPNKPILPLTASACLDSLNPGGRSPTIVGVAVVDGRTGTVATVDEPGRRIGLVFDPKDCTLLLNVAVRSP
jgi:hypothetical protein